MAVIYSAGSGNWNVGATWVGGTSPGVGDDAVILGSHTVTLTQNEGADSLEVQATGTIAGGGFEFYAHGQNGAGLTIDLDGVVSGVLDIQLGSEIAPNTAIDLIATAGNVRTLTVASTGDTTFNGNTTIVGGCIVTSTLLPSANADTLTCQYMTINGALGSAGWTGTITLTDGGWSGTGVYTHGNQTVDNSSTTGGEDIANTFTFYNFTFSGSGVKEIANGAVITVQNTFTIGAGVLFTLKGSASDSTLNIGTVSAQGTIANAGTLRAHTSSGTSDTYLQAVSASYFALLTGAGVYDWDYGTSNGEVHWKWLYHQGTNASAKTTGGGGVTIVMDNECRFAEDFEVALNDTMEKQAIRIGKDWTQTGTVTGDFNIRIIDNANEKIITNGTGYNLNMRGTGTVMFKGTCLFSNDIQWQVGTVDLLAYDSTSSISSGVGITVPGTAYFGGDSAGLLGDGVTAVSSWSANMSFGYVDNSGDFYFSSGITTITAHNSNVALTNADTIYHNDGTIKFTGTALQQVDTNGDDLYRVDNTNTTATVEFITTNFNLDGIFFRTGTITEADTADITVTGYTPALGIDSPFTHDELETAGRLVETSGGSFIFDFDPPTSIEPGDYRVMYTTTDTDQDYILNVKYKKAMDRYARYAEIFIDDVDGGQADNYTTGDPVRLLYHNDVEWVTVWRGFAEDIENAGVNHPTAKVTCYGFEVWFRKRKVSLDLSFRDHTLHEVLEILIKTHTPITWDATKISTDSNPTTLRPIFQGMDVDECIREMLELSDNEEYFVDNNFKFNVRQRATSHDGTYDSPVSYLDTTNITSYDFEEMGSEEVNRVEVKFGANLDKMVVAENTARQDALKTQTGASQAVVITQEYSRSDISLLANAQAYADYRLNAKKTYLFGKITSYDSQFVEAGMITEVTIADKDDYSTATPFKVLQVDYDHASDKTVLLVIEPAILIPKLLKLNGMQGRITGLQAYTEKTDSQVADNPFDTQTKQWDSMADLNLFTLGGNQATNVAGFIECSGATVGTETTVSPWITPGTGADFVFWYAFIRYVQEQNDGTLAVYIEGDVTGRVLVTEDYTLLRDLIGNTEQIRISLDFTWAGAGTSPKFYYGSISWK